MNIDSLVLRNSRFLFSFVALCVIILVFFGKVANSQTMPVGISESIEDSVRRSQLLSNDSNRFSYMVRPVQLELESPEKKIVKSLPILWHQQYNTSRAFGGNDGSLVPANGYQTMLSGGVFLKYGIFSVQFRPELIFAENKDYREIHETNNGQGFQNVVSSRLNRIDLPSRFGSRSYTDINWGQSNVKITYHSVSFALSNENLWWGPGIYNSLLMSNNAPGFKHLSLNTSKPVKTAIGSFEGQLIGGRLENSGVHELEGTVISPKKDDWRYLSGMVITYQPRWTPNLYLGFDRSLMIYHSDMGNGIADYLPIFNALTKSTFNNEEGTVNSEDQRNRDQFFSVFARWVLPESKAEIYAQYGKTDFAWDLRDAVVEPEHSRAYIVGFRKLISLNKRDEYLQLGIELTQMSGSNTGELRDEPSWYVHSLVPAGYTHKGQILGAAVGVDNDQQNLSLNWVSGLKRMGLTFSYITNDYGMSRTVNGDRKSWTDIALFGNYDRTYKNFIVNSSIGYIRSNNYLYENKENYPGHNVNNVQLRLGLLYNL